MPQKYAYKNNAHNRKLGRVGEPYGPWVKRDPRELCDGKSGAGATLRDPDKRSSVRARAAAQLATVCKSNKKPAVKKKRSQKARKLSRQSFGGEQKKKNPLPVSAVMDKRPLAAVVAQKQPGTKAPKSKPAAGVPAVPANSFALSTSGISSAFLNDYPKQLAPRSYQ